MNRKLSSLVARILVASLILWTGFGTTMAHAGQRRVATTSRINDPSTPEPTAALVFALGVGVVAWSARSRRRD